MDDYKKCPFFNNNGKNYSKTKGEIGYSFFVTTGKEQKLCCLKEIKSIKIDPKKFYSQMYSCTKNSWINNSMIMMNKSTNM